MNYLLVTIIKSYIKLCEQDRYGFALTAQTLGDTNKQQGNYKICVEF